jgi:hypothetical protein
VCDERVVGVCSDGSGTLSSFLGGSVSDDASRIVEDDGRCQGVPRGADRA